MDVTQIRSLLEQAQQATRGGGGTASAPAREFADLLSNASDRQRSAQAAFDRFAIEGEGELHDVMAQMAKADVTFRFLLEVRNKLTEAYQEVSRLQV